MDRINDNGLSGAGIEVFLAYFGHRLVVVHYSVDGRLAEVGDAELVVAAVCWFLKLSIHVAFIFPIVDLCLDVALRRVAFQGQGVCFFGGGMDKVVFSESEVVGFAVDLHFDENLVAWDFLRDDNGAFPGQFAVGNGKVPVWDDVCFPL